MGHETRQDWEPKTDGFRPTSYAPGTLEKIKVLRKRLEQGFPLWHESDMTHYAGVKEAIVYGGDDRLRLLLAMEWD